MPSYPQIFRVRQVFPASRLDDVPGRVREELTRLNLAAKLKPGQTVAIAAGSRGISGIAQILRAIVEHLRSLRAEPFIVPAMGSHGGGTAEGQRRVLETYGITEPAMGCPIRSSMETVLVCRTVEGLPVHFDRNAFEADHVLVCNRIKLHTGFTGQIQSGLMKMMLIGLGNRNGAQVYHQAVHDYGFPRIVRSVAAEVMRRCRILAGLAIVENAYDETALIEAVAPADLESREKQLLELATQWMPRLPFRQIDLLLVDRIGKDVSGTGLDPNVIGRKFNRHEAVEDEWPKARWIAIRGLTDATHGNATGIGFAELCKSRVLGQVDVAATRLNAVTSADPAAAMTPLDYPTDREILDVALGAVEPATAKLLWISDTLHLAEVECSAVFLDEARSRDDLEVLTAPRDLPLDASGNLPDFETLTQA